MFSKKKEKLYIVFSYTGTLFSKFLKIMTWSKYVHLSISFDKDLKEIYSFGRKNPRNIFPAGFTKEDPRDMIKVYKKMVSIVYELEIDKTKVKDVKKDIEKYIEEENKFRYDILGMPLMFFGKSYNRKYHRVCSQFVGKLLQDNNIHNFNKHYSLIKPVDIYNMKNKKVLFQGRMKDYLEEVQDR